MIETMKEAKSVIGSINSGKSNALTIGGETVFWQREEWVRWALDEVLPLIEQAIAEAEKQEPTAWMHPDWITYTRAPSPSVSYRENWIPLYTHPQPKREPLTDEQLFNLAEIAWRHGWASCRDAEYIGEEAEDERWGMIGAEVVQNIAAHGIKVEA